MTADDWKRRSVYVTGAGESVLRTRHSEKGTHLEILCNFPDQPLERQLPDKQLRGLLVASDFTKSDSPGPEAMGFLDTTSGSLRRVSISDKEWPRACERRTAAVLLRETLEASCLRGALPPVDLRAVCLVRAMFKMRLGRGVWLGAWWLGTRSEGAAVES